MIGAALLLGPLASPAVAQDADLRDAQREAGQTRWISGINTTIGVSFCPRADSMLLASGCKKLKSGAVKIIRALRPPGMSEGIWFEVVIESGQTGFIPNMPTSPLARESPQVVAKREMAAKEAADAICKAKGQPQVGMTQSQVEETCWGHPRRVNTTTTAGHRFDQMFYAASFYVYLTDGVVTAVQSSR